MIKRKYWEWRFKLHLETAILVHHYNSLISALHTFIYTRRQKEMKVHGNYVQSFFTWLKMWMLISGMPNQWERWSQDSRHGVKPIQNVPGLYYQHEAEVRWYSTKQKVVTCLDFKQTIQNVDNVGKHTDLREFCY
jgi:hypothetical protein